MKRTASEDTTPRASVPSAGATHTHALLLPAVEAARKGEWCTALAVSVAVLPVLKAEAGEIAGFAEMSANDGYRYLAPDFQIGERWKATALAVGNAYCHALLLAKRAEAEIRKAARAEDEEESCKIARHLTGFGPAAKDAERFISRTLKGEDSLPRHEGPTWVTLYTIELCDGGPEEGGWHYTWEAPVATIRIEAGEPDQWAVDALKALAKAKGLTLEGRSYRSACSAGRVDAVIHTGEMSPMESTSHTRPHYE